MSTVRNRRAGVEDRWTKRIKQPDGTTTEVPSAVHGKVTRWRARYVGPDGKERTKHFDRKRDATRWIDRETSKIETGSWVDPVTAKTTLRSWSEQWLKGYGSRRASTVRQAKVHLDKINETFGDRQLDHIRPSEVRNWIAGLKTSGYADSYVFALHSRLSQLYWDAIQDGIVARSPVSRRTSPGAGKPRPYVATTEQVWALHDAMPERYQAGVLLSAFAGLRLSEVCGLRVADVDFMRGVISPAVQYPEDPLKTDMSMTPVPIPNSLALRLSAHVADHSDGKLILTDDLGQQVGPWKLQRAFRTARSKAGRTVKDLPPDFRFHDFRHYYASLLISSGADVKVVQARMRHGSAKTTLDTYGHLWPDSDDSTRAAINSVITARDTGASATAESLRNRADG